MSIKIEISSTVWIFHASGFFNHFNLGTTSPVGSCRFVPVVILCWYAAKAKAPPVFSSQTSSTFVHPMTASSASWKEVCIQPCLTSQAYFQCTLSRMCECQWPAGWHQLSRRHKPKLVTYPSLQVFHPIYLSLLPMTRHGEMDTETPLHIDSGSCNSQERSSLSPVSSFHFLYVREKETAWDRVGDNVSRQKSIFSSCLPTLSKSKTFGNSKCLRQCGGQKVSKQKAKAGKD